MPVPGQVDSRGGDSAGLCRLAAAAIVGAALAAYAGGLRGPLLYDDAGSVANNPSIRHFGTALAPPSSGWPVSGRPVFNFSLALNQPERSGDPVKNRAEREAAAPITFQAVGLDDLPFRGQ